MHRLRGRNAVTISQATGAYDGYSDARLKETHGYWMSIIRAAKNPAQRDRADRNCAEVAAEMRKRGVRP
jgi:hypothetical protein